MNKILIGLVLIMVATASWGAQPPQLDQLLKPLDTDFFSVSPGGDKIATTLRIGDRMMLAILDRATLKPIKVFDPEEKGAVKYATWVNNERLFIMNSRVGGSVQEAYLEPYIIAINADGSRKTRVL